MKTARKGFTLVELLIVIVVIGILSAMMMLSSNEAVTTARANNVASNLRNLKTAALAYYTDHITDTEADNFKLADKKDDIFGYLSGKTEIPDKGDYSFIANNGKWYVQYEFKTTMTGEVKIREKLAGRTKALGLMDDSYAPYAKGKMKVLLRVR
ncbi:MAG: type II secretion system protein [Synergistaceae bacterium]|nr:type II secretion system protein [Synergistaceae bacterium]